MDLLLGEVPGDRLVVTIGPGKVTNRVWLTTGERGVIGDAVWLAVLRDGVDELERLIVASGVGGSPVIGIEATGALHRAWAAEVERRWPGWLGLFAPSETQAARAQLGSRRFKTDDRDCAALVWLLRQGAGRPSAPSAVEVLLGAVRHRRQLVDARRVLQQRLHDQLNALCPRPLSAGWSRPGAQARGPIRPAVLACAVAFAGRAPSNRSLLVMPHDGANQLAARPPWPSSRRTRKRAARRRLISQPNPHGHPGPTQPPQTPRSTTAAPTPALLTLDPPSES